MVYYRMQSFIFRVLISLNIKVTLICLLCVLPFFVLFLGAAMIKLLALAVLACTTVSINGQLLDLAALIDLNLGGGGGGCQDVDAIDRTLRDVSLKAILLFYSNYAFTHRHKCTVYAFQLSFL